MSKRYISGEWLGGVVVGIVGTTLLWLILPSLQIGNGTQGTRDAAHVANVFDGLVQDYSENQRFFEGPEVVFDHTLLTHRIFKGSVVPSENVVDDTVIGEFSLFKLPDDEMLCGIGYGMNGDIPPYLLLQNRVTGKTSTMDVDAAVHHAESDTASYSIIRKSK
ncbi:MAG: hypothetical protein RLN60_00310 [Phycisphaerales bacterium]